MANKNEKSNDIYKKNQLNNDTSTDNLVLSDKNCQCEVYRRANNYKTE